jgi:nucleoside-diphosphate-sugar epimerase
MNIIVFGGGTVGKFGHDFCLRARSEGHKVIIFSHKLNGTNDTDQHVIEYTNLDQINEVLNNTCSNLEKIDLVLFNQVGGSYPCNSDVYKEPNLNMYLNTLNSLVTVPHLFISKFNNKFHKDTKILNMTTNLAMEYDKNNHISGLVGYAGSKSWSTHLIQGYARHDLKNGIYFTISPSMNYDSEEIKQTYNIWFDSLYNLILNADEKFNGKIITAWKNNEHRFMKTSFIYSDL